MWVHSEEEFDGYNGAQTERPRRDTCTKQNDERRYSRFQVRPCLTKACRHPTHMLCVPYTVASAQTLLGGKAISFLSVSCYCASEFENINNSPSSFSERRTSFDKYRTYGYIGCAEGSSTGVVHPMNQNQGRGCWPQEQLVRRKHVPMPRIKHFLQVFWKPLIPPRSHVPTA